MAKKITLQPNDTNLPFKFPFTAATNIDQGSIPQGTSITSATVTCQTELGIDVTSEVVGNITAQANLVVVELSYPAVTGTGVYYLSVTLHLDSDTDADFQFPLRAVDIPSTVFQRKVESLIKDDGDYLEKPEDIIHCINSAFNSYSDVNPNIKVVDIEGDATYDYDLPVDWVDGFSQVLSIELPVGYQRPTILHHEDYGIYQAPSGKKLRFTNTMPNETFRVTYFIPRVVATLPEKDTEAVQYLAASFACEILASVYAQTSDNTIGAEVVNYRTKAQEFEGRAKKYKLLYKNHVGMKENDNVPAANAIGDINFRYPWSISPLGRYLTHLNRR